jgi:hypothetical protein
VYLFQDSSTRDERPLDDNESVPLSIAHTSNTVIINMERRLLADVDGLHGKRKRRKPRDYTEQYYYFISCVYWCSSVVVYGVCTVL